jgi:hypothetical protein
MKLKLLICICIILPTQARESTLREDITIGSLVGALEVGSVGQPLTYRVNMKINNQPLSKNPLHYYKGGLFHIGLITGVTALQVSVDGSLQRLLKQHPTDKLSTIQTAATGFTAGALSAIIATPQEMVPLYMQMQNNNLIQYTQRMKFSADETATYLKENGISTQNAIYQLRSRIYSAFSIAATRDGIYTLGYIGAYEKAKELIKPSSNLEKAALGSAIGMGTALVSQPLQVLKVAKQGKMAEITNLEFEGKKVPNELLLKSKYNKIFKEILIKKGSRGLFETIRERSARIAVIAILYALLEERAKDMFDD